MNVNKVVVLEATISTKTDRGGSPDANRQRIAGGPLPRGNTTGKYANAIRGAVCALGVLFAGAVALPTWAEEAEKPTVVPVKKAPFHRFTFEDENMALENVTLPPGKSTSYHLHDQDLVFVITSGARITNQVLGKEPTELEFKLGEVRFASYTKTPGVHQIVNIEKDKTMQILAVAIVYPEAGRYTVSTRPAKYEMALDNDRVRAWRLKLNPGESAPAIRQTAPGARFVVAGGTIAEKRNGQPDQPLVLKNHDFASMPAEERGVENIGNTPVEIVEIELK
jgi:hypothetical protein